MNSEASAVCRQSCRAAGSVEEDRRSPHGASSSRVRLDLVDLQGNDAFRDPPLSAALLMCGSAVSGVITPGDPAHCLIPGGGGTEVTALITASSQSSSELRRRTLLLLLLLHRLTSDLLLTQVHYWSPAVLVCLQSKELLL